MRRKHHAFLAAVSFAALMGVSASSYALTPSAVDMGMLRAQAGWKVGTVDAAGGSAYCAMVGNFDKNVVLAFARNPQGLGSLALDFETGYFERGMEYEVSLKTQGVRTRTLVGRASSEKSIVVQIGDDAALFDAFARDGALDVSLPTVNASFSLRKFSSSYKNLVECASGLTDGGKTQDRQAMNDAALAPIDREVQKLASNSVAGDKAAKEAALLEKNLRGKTSSFDEIEAQLEREAEAERNKTQKTIAKLDTRKESLTEKIETQKQEIAKLEEDKASTERKLIGSMGAAKAAAVAEMTEPAVAVAGASAQQIEQQQIAVAKFLRDEAAAKRSAWLEKSVEEKDKQIAALEAQKAKDSEAFLADFRKRQEALNAKTAELKKEAVSLAAAQKVDAVKAPPAVPVEKVAAAPLVAPVAAASDRAVKAGIVARQAEIAAANAERVKQTQELSKKLADTQEGYTNRIAALEAERDSLKKQLDNVLADNFSRLIEPASGSEDVSAKLAAAEKEKAELATRLSAAEKQNQLLQASIAATNVSPSQKGIISEAEVARLKADHAATLAALQKRLDEKSSQHDLLKKQFDAQQAELALIDAEKAKGDGALTGKLMSVTSELAAKKAEVEKLEASLKKVEEDKAAAAAHAEKTSAELAQARAEIAELKKGLGADQQRLTALQESLNKQKLDLERQALAQTREVRQPVNMPAGEMMASERAELFEARARIKMLEERIAQNTSAGMPAEGAAMMAEIEKRSADISRKERELAAERAAFEAEKGKVAGMFGDSGKLDEAQAEISRLKNENASLQKELQAKALNAQEPAAGSSMAEVAQPVQPKESFGSKWFATGYAKKSPETQTAPVDSRDNFAVPAVPSVAVVREEVPAPVVAAPKSVTPAVVNNASAFLDKIMSYHRPGSKAVAVEAVDDESFMLPEEPVVTADADVAPVAASRVAEATKDLARIETASGTPSAPVAPVVREQIAPSPYVSAATSYPVSSVVGNVVPAAEPKKYLTPELAAANATVVRKQIAASPVTIEQLLDKSGVKGASFEPQTSGAGEFVRQWTTGNISGMLEVTPSSGRGFESDVQAYLDRYREDCPGNLQVSVGASDVTPAGATTVADVSCGMQGNTYVTSFVFTESAGGFGAVLHTGYPSDAAKVRSIGDNVAYTLSSSGGLVTDGARKAEVTTTTMPVPATQYRLTVPQAETSTATPAGDDFETVVIQ